MTADETSLELSLDARTGVPVAIDGSRLDDLVAYALRSETASEDWLVGVVMTTDDEIQEMHRDFMGLDTPTDIMTFPYEEEDPFTPEELWTAGGDIVISVDTARFNANDAGWSLERELQFLVLHGILHLLGWDDATPGQRVAMLGRQRQILDCWLAEQD